jgi:hypothetical protein
VEPQTTTAIPTTTRNKEPPHTSQEKKSKGYNIDVNGENITTEFYNEVNLEPFKRETPKFNHQRQGKRAHRN